MKVFVRKQLGRWEELEDIKEISVDLESGGQIDLFQTDSETLRAMMCKGAKLNIETP